MSGTNSQFMFLGNSQKNITHNTTDLSVIERASAPSSGSRNLDNPFVLVSQFPNRGASDCALHAARVLRYRQHPSFRSEPIVVLYVQSYNMLKVFINTFYKLIPFMYVSCCNVIKYNSSVNCVGVFCDLNN